MASTTTTGKGLEMPHVIFGTMTFGTGTGGRISDLDEIRRILDLYASYGHRELDTARAYCGGNTEETLAKVGVQPRFKIATKVYPAQPGDHEPEKLKATFRQSLKALNTKHVDIFYLHAPDRTVPYEDTLRAVQDLYEEGTFAELALSNYAAFEVMQIYWICKTNGWILPTLYQGMYNAITRDVERELFPCLRALGMRFYAYNPLAGGLLSGHYKFEDKPAEGRFAPSHSQGERYRERYWNKLYFEAVENIKEVAAKHSLTTVEIAQRWLSRHSKLDFSLGDGNIIGASSYDHAKESLDDAAKGPLPEEVIKVLDAAWEHTKAICPSYGRL
ncbi:hypothetical protein HKX48_007522 [Thoreauomyces humboldtii]|nr:hypothetical protein HKX48_007522 [Thoreauomyces humboldtii]